MADTCKTTKKYLPLGENLKKIHTKTTDSMKHRQKVVLLMELNA